MAAAGLGCGDDLTDPTGTSAPDFTLADANPTSPTYGELRSLHARESNLVLLYFASFG